MQVKAISVKIIEEIKRLKEIEESLRPRLMMPWNVDIIFAKTDKDDRLGYYDNNQKLIVLDISLLTLLKEDIDAVFLHELAHSEDYARRGFSEHDHTFREICHSLGVPKGFDRAKIKGDAVLQEKRKDKVEKLLRLSESPFESESSSALIKAQELMAKYAIKNEENEDMLYSTTLDKAKKHFYYEKAFFSIISKLSGTYIIREKDKDGVFNTNAYGSSEQVVFAYETYHFLLDSLSKAYYNALVANSLKVDKNSFYTGLSSALYERVESLDESDASKALIVSYDDNRARYKSIYRGIRIKRSRNKTRYSSSSSFSLGEKAAKNIDLNNIKRHGNIKKIEFKN